MTEKRYNVKELELAQDEIGAWYYTLNNVPYTGCAVQYYTNGIQAAESNFIEGYQEGVQRIWFPNGNLKIECYKTNNISNGKSLEWFENGVLKYEAEYDMGVRLWSKRYNEQGELIKEYP